MDEKEIRDKFQRIDERLSDGNERFTRLEIEGKHMRAETARVAKASEQTANVCNELKTTMTNWTAEQKGEAKANRRYITALIIFGPAIPIILWELFKHFSGWH